MGGEIGYGVVFPHFTFSHVKIVGFSFFCSLVAFLWLVPMRWAGGNLFGCGADWLYNPSLEILLDVNYGRSFFISLSDWDMYVYIIFYIAIVNTGGC